jgi:hypothetical protein
MRANPPDPDPKGGKLTMKVFSFPSTPPVAEGPAVRKCGSHGRMYEGDDEEPGATIAKKPTKNKVPAQITEKPSAGDCKAAKLATPEWEGVRLAAAGEDKCDKVGCLKPYGHHLSLDSAEVTASAQLPLLSRLGAAADSADLYM